MQGNKNIAPLRVGHFRTIVERRIFVRLACQNDAKSLSLQRNSHQPRKSKYDVALGNAGRTARARVRAAMGGIEDHDGQNLLVYG